ncbi:MAG: hypothetical protein KDI19_02405 [Pseudomonadales bacterium]|nr:hypothetical protein [Pseudomonadales bacterium]
MLRFALLLVGLLASVSTFADDRYALANALYLLHTEGRQAAWSRAIYYEARGVDANTAASLVLLRAGLALDAGDEAAARQAIDALDEAALSPENRARLHLQLARVAFSRADYDVTAEELGRVEPGSAIASSPRYHYLAAEVARVRGRLGDAYKLIQDMASDEPLRAYATYNLAVSRFEAGEHTRAIRLFEQVARIEPDDPERFLLAEQSRVALAEMAALAQDSKVLERRVADIAADDAYGPAAISLLARDAMQGGRYEQAASLWKLVTERDQAGPSGRVAPLALAWSIEQARSSAEAFGFYVDAEQSLGGLRARLADVAGQVASLSPVELTHLVGADAPDTNADLLALIAPASDRAGRQLVRRIRTLHDALGALEARRRDVSELLAVDREQQRRVAQAFNTMQESALRERLDRIEREARSGQLRATQLLDDPTLADATAYAAPADLEMLAALDDLAARATASGADVSIQSRVNLLRGIVRYRLFDDLPDRARAAEARAENLVIQSQASRSRMARVETAWATLGNRETASGRLLAASQHIDALSAVSSQALARAGETLRARLQVAIADEIRATDAQLTAVRLSIARISDERLVADGDVK